MGRWRFYLHVLTYIKGDVRGARKLPVAGVDQHIEATEAVKAMLARNSFARGF